MAAGYRTSYTRGNLPLLMGMNFKDRHAEDPNMQRKLSSLNTPKIFFFKDNKVPKIPKIPNI